MSSMVLVGLGIAAVGLVGRQLVKNSGALKQAMKTMDALPQQAVIANNSCDNGTLEDTLSVLKVFFVSFFIVNFVKAFSKYYKGGFDAKMTKREAGLILGVSPNSSKARVKEAHKRIMLLNHPDRGGSPYLAAKINEAKDIFDQTSSRS